MRFMCQRFGRTEPFRMMNETPGTKTRSKKPLRIAG